MSTQEEIEAGLQRLRDLHSKIESGAEAQGEQLEEWVRLSGLGVKNTVLAKASGVSDAAVSQALLRHARRERQGAKK